MYRVCERDMRHASGLQSWVTSGCRPRLSGCSPFQALPIQAVSRNAVLALHGLAPPAGLALVLALRRQGHNGRDMVAAAHERKERGRWRLACVAHHPPGGWWQHGVAIDVAERGVPEILAEAPLGDLPGRRVALDGHVGPTLLPIARHTISHPLRMVHAVDRVAAAPGEQKRGRTRHRRV